MGWMPEPGGGGSGDGDLTLINDQLLASNAAAITFSSIPDTFQSLLLVCRLRTTNASIFGAAGVRVGNGTLDTGSNYSWGRRRHGTTTDNAESSSDTSWYAALVTGATGATGRFGTLVVRIVDYADTSQRRHAYTEGAVYAAGANYVFTKTAGIWQNTSDVIDIVSVRAIDGSNLLAGSQVSLYGVA